MAQIPRRKDKGKHKARSFQIEDFKAMVAFEWEIRISDFAIQRKIQIRI